MTNPKVLREQFNALFLPVRWETDKKNPGKIDEGELWISPILKAVNTYLEATNQAQINYYDMANKILSAMKKNKPANSLRHSLLTQDIQSRRRFLVKYNLDEIKDPAVKKATIELIKAAAFADIYYNFQMDPEYVAHLVQLLNSGDITSIRHFFQNGPFCVSVEDAQCTPLEGLKLDQNGIWWPDDFSSDDIKFIIEEYQWGENVTLKRKVITPTSCIVEAKKEDQDAFEYKGKYYRPVSINTFPQIKFAAAKMAEHILAAANILRFSQPKVSEFLDLKAKELMEGGIFGDRVVDEAWAKLEEKDLVSSFGRVECFRGNKSDMQGLVAFVQRESQDVIDKSSTTLATSDQKFWNLWEKNGETYPLPKVPTTSPSSKVVKLIYSTGEANSSVYVPAGLNQPNFDNYIADIAANEQFHGIMNFPEILAARITEQGIPLAKLAFSDKVATDLLEASKSERSIIAFIQAHEINHQRGIQVAEEVTLKNGEKSTPQKIYGSELIDPLEEAKADLMGVMDFSNFKDKGVITQDEQLKAYQAYFGDILRCIFLNSATHGRAALIEFYLLSQAGIVSFDETTKKYSVAWDKFEEMLPKIVKMLMDKYISLDKEQVAELTTKAYSSYDNSELKKYVAVLEKQGNAKDNIPYYMPMGELGTL